MCRLIPVVLLLLTSCEQRPSTMTKSTAAGPVSPISVATYPAPEPVKLTLVTVPTARVAVGRNIWLETVKTEEAALASLVGDALNSLGSNLAVGKALSLSTQPLISWQKRTAGIERRVVLDLEVVLTRGYLEHLISRSEAGKDHESILSNQFDAEILNAALLGSGLVPGKPAKFINEQRELDFKPATGQMVKIYLEYEEADGKKTVVPAQSWVVGGKDSKPLTADWVFAGSFKGKSTTAMGEEFVYFAANDGRVVCLANFGSALLDLPFESMKGDPQGDTLSFRANTAVIPERGTKVRALFEAVSKK
ncbi:MAG TPA: YdjY domain-containing protein [Gemmatales bacterium]|nr:YdjY domain-containing protein [Gemmatales bacterium]